MQELIQIKIAKSLLAFAFGMFFGYKCGYWQKTIEDKEKEFAQQEELFKSDIKNWD